MAVDLYNLTDGNLILAKIEQNDRYNNKYYSNSIFIIEILRRVLVADQ